MSYRLSPKALGGLCAFFKYIYLDKVSVVKALDIVDVSEFFICFDINKYLEYVYDHYHKQ